MKSLKYSIVLIIIVLIGLNIFTYHKYSISQQEKEYISKNYDELKLYMEKSQAENDELSLQNNSLSQELSHLTSLYNADKYKADYYDSNYFRIYELEMFFIDNSTFKLEFVTDIYPEYGYIVYDVNAIGLVDNKVTRFSRIISDNGYDCEMYMSVNENTPDIVTLCLGTEDNISLIKLKIK